MTDIIGTEVTFFTQVHKCSKQCNMEEEDMLTVEEDGEIEDPDGFFRCTECDKSFLSASKLKSHTRVHAGQNLFGCKDCPAKFVYENQLKLHKKIHEGDGSYSCPQCPAKFTLAWSLKLHKQTHVKEKSFSCSECSAKFDRADSLKEHKQSHSLPYVCLQCKARFSTARNLWDHEIVHSGQGEGNNSDIPAEDSVTTTQKGSKGLFDLFSKELANKEVQHRCQQCTSSFASKDLLERHEKTHSGDKPFQCSRCQAKFAKMNSLKEHERKHAQKLESTGTDGNGRSTDKQELTDAEKGTTIANANNAGHGSPQRSQDQRAVGEKLHTCRQCNATFTKLYHLKRHLPIHTGRLAHRCRHCAAAFTTKKGLQNHEGKICPAKFPNRGMTRNAGYRCPECPATFQNRGHLGSHMMVHSGEDKPFHCQYCSARYCSENHLKNHQKVHKEVNKGNPRPTEVSSGGNKEKQLGGAQTSKKRKQGSQHPAKPSKDKCYACKECPAKFGSSAHLWSHMQVHAFEDKPHCCPLCTAKFDSPSQLTLHMKVHNDAATGTSHPQDVEPPENPSKKQKTTLKASNVRYSCSICNAEFLRPSALKVHWRTHEAEKPHKCSECPASFSLYDDLVRHKKVHKGGYGGKKAYNCQQCSASFSKQASLKIHLTTHTTEKVYSCPECPATFTSIKGLRSHSLAHDGTIWKEYRCQHCTASYRKLSTLKNHLKVHKEEDVGHSQEVPHPVFMDGDGLTDHLKTNSVKEYGCTECPRRFSRSDHLKSHMLIHMEGQGWKPYHCRFCSAKFSGKGHLKQHETFHMHDVASMDGPKTGTTKARKTYKCAHCLRLFINEKSFFWHGKKCFLAKGNRPYTCSHCPAKFALASTLAKHEKSHSKLHHCTKCPAKFTDANDLMEHLQIHRTKPYVCLECPARFCRADSLKNHMLVHADCQELKPYHCRFCSAKFSARSHLSQHESVHEEASEECENEETTRRSKRFYKCPHCLRQFITEKSFRMHSRQCFLSKGYRPFTCSLCPAKFTLASTLAKHEETHSCTEPEDDELEAESSSSTISRSGDDVAVKQYRCRECPAKFFSRSHLKRHMGVHNVSNQKPYSCSYCTAKFTVAGHLVQHAKIHTEFHGTAEGNMLLQSTMDTLPQTASSRKDGRGTYVCTVCSATFTQESHLVRHREVHVQHNFYSCSMCPAQFSQLSDLEDHKKVHSASIKESQISETSTEVSDPKSPEMHEEAHTGKDMYSHVKNAKWFTCQFCLAKFRGATRLAVHVNVHHWDLQQDSEPTAEATSQVQQTRDHAKNKTYSCPQCPSKFTKVQSLRIHRRIHQGANTHKCHECSAAFGTLSSLMSHKKAQHGEKPYSCPHCPAMFGRIGHRESHLKVHTREGVGLYRCPHCTAKFLREDSLKAHKKLHTGKKSYTCSECSASFTCSSHLSRHRKKHCGKKANKLGHSNNTPKSRSVKQPRSTSHSSKARKSDEDQRAASADRPFTCLKCSRKFLSSEQLEYHMVWHSGEQRHECSLCAQRFPTAQGLKEHRKTHAGERPFHCPMCPADFDWRSNLKRHVESKHFKEKKQTSHSGNKGNTENTPVNKNTEEGGLTGSKKSTPDRQDTNSVANKSHSTGKPAKGKRPRCSECKLTFSCLQNLERHQRIHTGEKPHVCPNCSLRFTRKDHLRYHINKHHAGNDRASPPDQERSDESPKKKLNRKDHLSSHINKQHAGNDGASPPDQGRSDEPAKKKFYNCPECPARFSTLELMTRHKKIHPASSKDRTTPNEKSAAESSNPATLDVMETQVVHERGAASHIEAVVVANLEQLPLEESADTAAQKAVETDDPSQLPGTVESAEFGQHPQTCEPPMSSSSTVHPPSARTQVSGVQASSAHGVLPQTTAVGCTSIESGQKGSMPAIKIEKPSAELQGCSMSKTAGTVVHPVLPRTARVSPLFETHLPLQEAHREVPAPGNVPLLAGMLQTTATTSPPQGVIPTALSLGETMLQASVANGYCQQAITVSDLSGTHGTPQGMGKTMTHQLDDGHTSTGMSTVGQVLQGLTARTRQLPVTHLGHSSTTHESDNRRRTENEQKGTEVEDKDVRYFCIGCRQVFATERDLKDHLQGVLQQEPNQGNLVNHKIVMLQKKSADQGRTAACSESNVLAVPKQNFEGILQNCSHVFCVLCAGKVNINDLSHHVKIKHGFLEGKYPFGQATSCMTCSHRLYGEEDVQKHASQQHIVLRDTAGPFLAYDNTKILSNAHEDQVQHSEESAAGVCHSESSNRMKGVKEGVAVTTDSCSDQANVDSVEAETSRKNKDAALLSGSLLSKDAQKRKFLIVSRAAEAWAKIKKKRYLVIRGSDCTDRSSCSSPQTDCSGSHTTTSSPPLVSEQPPSVLRSKDGGEKTADSVSGRLEEQPGSTDVSPDTSGLQQQLALVASVLSATLAGKSSTDQNPKTDDHRGTVTSDGMKSACKTLKGVEGLLGKAVIKTEPVTVDDDESAEVGLSAASDGEDTLDLGDVSAINEPLMSIKEEAPFDDF